MTLVFYSLFLNHHQACVADEFFKLLGTDYNFVELSASYDNKGASKDYTSRPYLIQAWKSAENYEKAMNLALTADACVFAGYESLPFEIARLKRGLLSFDMGERLLKRGIINLASPRILKLLFAYYKNGWRNRPLYKLCCSAFTAKDCNNLGIFKGRCYKWGYFTDVDTNLDILSSQKNKPISIMWCARFLTWKHPELAVESARVLRDKGYKFHLNMFGDDASAGTHDKLFPVSKIQALIDKYDLSNFVTLRGKCPNDEILRQMRSHNIFLFTSDRREGWGAVANEAMANGCVLVASDKIGSVPYLVQDGINGFMFKSGNAEDLTQKITWLLDNPTEMEKMRQSAVSGMKDKWAPEYAANALIQLVDNFSAGKETTFTSGPCSKA